MSQQINLLVSGRRRSLSGASVLAIPGLAFIVLLGIWINGHQEVARLQAAEAASARRLLDANAALQARSRSTGSELVAEVAALRQQAEAAQKIRSMAADLGDAQGYSRHFSTLARIREDGLWLTKVAIGHGGQSFSLGGLTLRKDAVMRYAERVNAAFADEGVQFTMVELGAESAGRVENGIPQVEAVTFTLKR